MDNIIDFEKKKFFKELDDDFYKFVEKIEQHFNYNNSDNVMLDKLLYSLRYLFNISTFLFEERKIKKEYKEFIIKMMKEMVTCLEESESERE